MPLTASQRVALIKEIANRLCNEDWPMIDVTLEQFGLPTSNQWGSSQQSYVLEMIKHAQDQSLTDLALHVGYHFEVAVTGIDPPFWRKGMLRLFISHLASHRGFAAELQEALLAFGISAFVAHSDIEPTKEWQTQIETALATCDTLLALLHPEFHESKWTDQEIGFAMGRGVAVFSVRLGHDPYGFIGRFQAFNGSSKPAAVLAEELCNAYRKNKQTQHRMAEVVVTLFEESGSFAGAKTRVGYLEDLEIWEPSFATRITSAAQANSQIVGSWGVAGRIEALVKKWANQK